MTHPIDKMLVDPPLTLAVMQREVLETNRANGWFDDNRDFAADVALLHTEVSEMFEAYREDKLEDRTRVLCAHKRFGADYDAHDAHLADGGHICKPEGVGSEAADVLIRLLDTCERAGIDLEFEYRRKLAFNKTRGYRHGGKHI